MLQRNFYLIGHNPNTIEAVKECMSRGMNAIEPDVSFHKDMPEKFYVHEDIAQIPNFIEHLFWGKFPSLKEYLTGLKNLLKENPSFDLKMILFDLKKDYEYDINDLYKIIRENFSNEYPHIKILTSMNVPDEISFLGNLKDQRQNEFLGMDENTEPEYVHEFFKDKNLKYFFAAGTSLFSTTVGKFTGRIERALNIRDDANTESEYGSKNKSGFSFVYPWCVNHESSMREYLDMPGGIDAMLTDEPERLIALLNSEEYKNRFRIKWDDKLNT